jgi:CRISPR-associated protein Csm1
MTNEKEKIRQEIYLGALLHDIGKFYQRASGEFQSNNSNLSEEVKKIADYICPVNQNGYFRYQHVLWTYQFFINNKKIFNKVLNIENVNEPSQDNCINFAIYHHRPHSESQALIQLADWWASGIDRTTFEEYAVQDINWGKDKYKKVPLSAILQNVSIKNDKHDRTKENKEWYFNLNKLDIQNKDTIFPKLLDKDSQISLESEYKKLWNEFDEEFKNLPTADFEVFVESLYYLLKKYTWCMPASTIDYPDSSLFEHSKMVAAFADCLYRYYHQNPDAFNYNKQNHRIKLNENQYPVILLCADISGIQKFIYDITSKRAAKSLRGRSFYLQMLIETITNQLLEETKSFRSNVVYSSGGKMFMLLPNTKEVTETVQNYRKKVEQWIWNTFQGSIYVSFDYVPFSFDLENKTETGQNILIYGKDGKQFLGDLWKEVVDKTAQWKNKKFKSIIENDDNFFEPFGEGGETEVCAITGIESNHLELIEKDDEEEIRVLPIVKEQIELGEKLVKHEYIVYAKYKQKQIENVSDSYNYPLNILGSYWYILEDESYNQLTSIDNAIIYKENNFDFLSNKKGDKSTYAYRFYGGNIVPTINKKIKTFEELVDKNASFKRLAILRMDVDNLSQIFINGFKEKDENGKIKSDRSNFSKLSTLSFQLDLFFSGYLNQIHKKYLDNVIVIYSGGDDLFAVGDWQAIIAFAEDIRNEFRKYACNREDISLSGGIAMVNEKFPIAKAADLAGEAENKAKKFVEEKNTLNFLGENISWFKEFDAAKALKDYLYDALKNEKLTKGLLQKIYVFRDMKNNNNIGWQWLSAYTFARHTKENNKDIIEKLKILFFTGSIELDGKNYQFGERAIDLLAIATRWADLIIRSERN